MPANDKVPARTAGGESVVSRPPRGREGGLPWVEPRVRMMADGAAAGFPACTAPMAPVIRRLEPRVYTPRPPGGVCLPGLPMMESHRQRGGGVEASWLLTPLRAGVWIESPKGTCCVLPFLFPASPQPRDACGVRRKKNTLGVACFFHIRFDMQ